MRTHHFKFYEVSTGTPEYETYLAFRHQVFCLEFDQIPEYKMLEDGRCHETDEFDEHSRHWMAIDPGTGEPVACCRLILPSPLGLSVSRRYSITEHPYSDARRETTAEISRMAIAAPYRRQRFNLQNAIAVDLSENDSNSTQTANARAWRYQPELVLGMYREIFLHTKDAGITHAYAAMTSNFGRLLMMSGFPFRPVGPLNTNYIPARRPYIISRSEILRRLAENKAFRTLCENLDDAVFD